MHLIDNQAFQLRRNRAQGGKLAAPKIRFRLPGRLIPCGIPGIDQIRVLHHRATLGAFQRRSRTVPFAFLGIRIPLARLAAGIDVRTVGDRTVLPRYPEHIAGVAETGVVRQRGVGWVRVPYAESVAGHGEGFADAPPVIPDIAAAVPGRDDRFNLLRIRRPDGKPDTRPGFVPREIRVGSHGAAKGKEIVFTRARGIKREGPVQGGFLEIAGFRRYPVAVRPARSIQQDAPGKGLAGLFRGEIHRRPVGPAPAPVAERFHGHRSPCLAEPAFIRPASREPDIVEQRTGRPGMVRKNNFRHAS